MKKHAPKHPASARAAKFSASPVRASGKCALLFLCAAFLLAATQPRARAADENKPGALKLKFTKGDVLNYAMKMDISGSMRMKGMPVSAMKRMMRSVVMKLRKV